jgi:hypothetical protein
LENMSHNISTARSSLFVTAIFITSRLFTDELSSGFLSQLC